MKILIIIPTYNERDNIEAIVKKIHEVAPQADVLVVDDNSPDGTAQVVESLQQDNPWIHLIKRGGKLGLGTAYVEGFHFALKNGYDCVFEMDADFSHNPEDIPRFLEAIKDADLVIGSRYTNGISVVNWPLSRLFLSYFANLYARVVTGLPVKDLTAGYKCIRKEVLEAIDWDEVKADGYGFQIEVNFLAWEKGFRLKEIPIIFVERRAGVSKMSKKIVWEAFWLVLSLRIRRIKKSILELFRRRR